MNKLIYPLIILLIVSSTYARVRCVDPNGTGDYPTIQAAVNAANDGDEVVLSDGIYTGPGNCDISLEKLITVRSENGPQNCIIDCNGTEKQRHSAFRVKSGATIAGITIINGYYFEGGAISFQKGSGAKIINCVLANNSAKFWGGAIYCNGSSTAVINCKITNNSALWAGASIVKEILIIL
jgi:predicted outer membrane repeat protein